MPRAAFAPFSYLGEEWRLFASGALWRPATASLFVADLHLEKASWYARQGQMLPPYDSQETLRRLAEAQRISGARQIWALGDTFHDDAGPARLAPQARAQLGAIAAAAAITWITGNHDPAIGSAALPGQVATTAMADGIALVHQAQPHAAGPELSGHFHPKFRAALAGRRIARPCAVLGGNRLILPAFGALTGGLDAASPAIAAALAPAAPLCALVFAGRAVAHCRLPAP